MSRLRNDPYHSPCVTDRSKISWGTQGSEGEGRGDSYKDKLTNRKSRGPCRTDALIVEAFDMAGMCIGAESPVAEGAIFKEGKWGAWDVSGMQRWDRCVQPTRGREKGSSPWGFGNPGSAARGPKACCVIREAPLRLCLVYVGAG